MPTLEIGGDGVMFAQSNAINRYISRKYGKILFNNPNDLFSKNIILCCFDNIKSEDEG